MGDDQVMTDREILNEVAELMEDALNRDEMQLKHVKSLHQMLAVHRQALTVILLLVGKEDWPNRDQMFQRVIDLLEKGDLESEAKRIVAFHESEHERRAGFLARMKEKLEALRDIEDGNDS